MKKTFVSTSFVLRTLVFRSGALLAFAILAACSCKAQAPSAAQTPAPAQAQSPAQNQAQNAGSRTMGSTTVTSTTAVSSATTGTLTAPLDHPTYALGAGDEVTVSVLDLDEMGKDPYRIDAYGNLTLPLIGSLHVSGLNVEQISNAISVRLSKYLKDPDVTVRLVDMRSQPVSVLGEVRTPGVIQLQGEKSLFEVLSMAGGLTPDAGYLIRITREKQWGEIPLPNAKLDETGEYWTAEVSVKDVINGTSPGKNIPVKPNDVITVPKGEIVYVLGAVKKSGGFVLGERDEVTVLQALAMAEGLDRFADTGDAKIIRQSGNSKNAQELPLDLKKILRGKATDVSLSSDDILFIPVSGSKAALSRTLDASVNLASSAAIYRPF